MPTHYTGSESEIRALNAYIKLMRAADTLGADLSRWLIHHDLSSSQFGVLEALLHLGPQHQIQIGEKLLKTSGNITMVVKNLEERGLIERIRDSNDRRAKNVQLSASGHKLIAGIFPEHAARIAEQFSVLDDEDQEMLGRLCKTLGTSTAKKARNESRA